MRKITLRYLPIFQTDLLEIVEYIRDTLQNPVAADNLLDDIEHAILKRSENPESFEQYRSVKERNLPYYRIYVKNYVIYYVVITGGTKIMEMRRILYNKRNKDFII